MAIKNWNVTGSGIGGMRMLTCPRHFLGCVSPEIMRRFNETGFRTIRDFKTTPALAVGPFVNFALGEYTSWSSSVTVNGTSQDQSGSLQDTGLHEWLAIGLRGQYNL